MPRREVPDWAREAFGESGSALTDDYKGHDPSDILKDAEPNNPESPPGIKTNASMKGR